MKKKYYFVTYNCTVKTWMVVAQTQGDLRFVSEHTQICQGVIDIHPLQFQLDCNEKYGLIDKEGYRQSEQYFVLNWIPVTEEEYNEYKDKIG